MKTSLCLISLLWLAGGVARAQVNVTPIRIEESRSVILHDDTVGCNEPEMKVLLSLAGPEAEAAVRYGEVKIEEAVDDTGASLIPKKNDFDDGDKFKDYDNAFFRKSSFGGGKPAAPEISLRLSPAKRSATKIARLRGSLSLSDAGTVQTIELASLKSAGTKKLDVPASANVTVTASVEAGDSVREVGLEITGDENALDSIDVVDARGEKVTSGMSSWSMMGGPPHRSLELTRPLDDSMKLVAKIALNRKVTKVSFDLKDIPLP